MWQAHAHGPIAMAGGRGSLLFKPHAAAHAPWLESCANNNSRARELSSCASASPSAWCMQQRVKAQQRSGWKRAMQQGRAGKGTPPPKHAIRETARIPYQPAAPGRRTCACPAHAKAWRLKGAALGAPGGAADGGKRRDVPPADGQRRRAAHGRRRRGGSCRVRDGAAVRHGAKVACRHQRPLLRKAMG